jgi:hypothetical protein
MSSGPEVSSNWQAGPEVAALRKQLGIPEGPMSEVDHKKLLRHVFDLEHEWTTDTWQAKYRAQNPTNTQPTEAELRRAWLRYWHGPKWENLYD